MIDQLGVIFGIITGVASTVLLLLLYFVDRRGVKQEQRFRWEDAYQKHSEQIGRTLFEAWNSKHVLASCSFDNYRFSYHEPEEPDIQYVGQARDHLTIGYPSIWTLYQQSKDGSVRTLQRLRDIVKSVESMAVERIEKSELGLLGEDWSSNVPKFYYVPGVVWPVFHRAISGQEGAFTHQRINTEVIDEKGVKSRRDLMELRYALNMVGRGEDQDMSRLELVAASLISDPQIQDMVEDYQELAAGLAKQAKEFDRVVLDLWSQIQAGQSLKGSCNLCPEKPS